MKHLLFGITLAFLLTGCRSVKYVPVETVRRDSVFKTLVQRDSIYLHDSIYVREKGDTVFETRFKYVYRDRVKCDTLYIEKRDSVQVPYPVEKPLTWWQRVKLGCSEIVILVVLVLAGIAVWRVQKK